MACIRLKRSGQYNAREQYDGIVETSSDLPTGTGKLAFNGSQFDLAPGSILYCLSTGLLYVRAVDGTWTEVT